jgi:protein-S-isoprenylcysteine O-methyltransferase Ste14
MISAATTTTTLALTVLVAALPTAAWLWLRAAPYGRHHTGGWGPVMDARLGWVLMECPSVLVFAGVYSQGGLAGEPLRLTLAAAWLLHYVTRTFVYPLRLRAPKPMPWVIAGSGALFNTVNATMNAGWIGSYSDYTASDPWIWIGLAVFGVGFAVNQHADTVLLRLRDKGPGYHIPTGGLYRWITCPNYLGELLEWAGWAIATGSLPGLAFFVYTAANLVPRAKAHHAWYRARFPDYPVSRRALLPGVW